MAVTVNILKQGAVILTGNPIRVSVAGAPAPVGATAYKYMLKITSTDAKVVGAPFYEAIAPPAQNIVYFDIQGYLDIAVKYYFWWPVGDASHLSDNTTFTATITGGTRYIDTDGVLHEEWNASGTDMVLLKGGVSQRQVAIWQANNQNFTSVYATKFLTQRPQDDICHTTQPVKLFQICTNAANDKLKFTCFYADGTSSVTDITIAQEANKLYELDVNPYYHNIAMVNLAGAKMLNWNVAIYSGTTVVTDIRRFAYDLRYCERPFWLMFTNSLGGIDDVYLSGFASEGFEVDGETVYKPAQYNDTIYDRTLIVPNKQGRNTWQINTGWKTATQMLHLRDLLLSREVWLLYPNNGVTTHYIIPVNIANSQAELVDRLKDLWEITIELTEAHNSQFSFDNRLY